MKGDFFQSLSSCSSFLWSHFQSLLGGMIRIDYLNRTLSLEVAFRARWVLDIVLVMEALPQGVRVFFQSWSSAMINTLTTYCPLCYQKMRTWHRKTIICACHKLMQFHLFWSPEFIKWCFGETVSIDPNSSFFIFCPAQIVCYLGKNHMQVGKE